MFINSLNMAGFLNGKETATANHLIIATLLKHLDTRSQAM